MEENKEIGRKVSIDIVKANGVAVIIMIVAIVVFLFPFFLIWSGPQSMSERFSISWGWFLLAVFVGIIVHELIHGLTWSFYAKRGWRSISFGVMWKLLTPYCHCSEPLPIRGYMAGALMPFIVMGLIPAIVALFIGSLPLLTWGIIFIATAAGDLWMAWLLTKERPDCMVLDHPSEAGYYIIDEKEMEESANDVLKEK
ncbi:MAG: DUF3267 domain-containing protein [Prevotella sp.]|nr:DUF3267 domain-containing protein [Prevotella sp.]